MYRRGLQAIPLSVDLWIHYINFLKETLDPGDPETNSTIRGYAKHWYSNVFKVEISILMLIVELLMNVKLFNIDFFLLFKKMIHVINFYMIIKIVDNNVLVSYPCSLCPQSHSLHGFWIVCSFIYIHVYIFDFFNVIECFRISRIFSSIAKVFCDIIVLYFIWPNLYL